MSSSGLTFTGKAAELAYSGLASVYKDYDASQPEARLAETITAPLLGTLKTRVRYFICNDKCVPSSITVMQVNDNGIYSDILECTIPNESYPSYGGGEFSNAVKAGALAPARLSSYTCRVFLR